MNAKLTADMSAAPEIARLAGAVLGPSAASRQPSADPHAKQSPAGPQDAAGPQDPQPTLGTLSRHLRTIAAAPERWWGLVRFDPDRPVTITVEQQPSYAAWLVVLPPGDTGQHCDCDVATVIAGEATEGAPASAALRPGPIRVHGQRHWLRGGAAAYSVSLHARAHRARAQGPHAPN